MDSESNQQSSQKSHKMFGDFNIFFCDDALFTYNFTIYGDFMNNH